VAFDTVSTARYMALLRYPQQSLNDHEEGVGLLLVTITKQGAVLGWSLNQSTGYGRLDREIRRVADKVKRLDPLPADFPRNRAIVRVRIIFHVVAPEG
jgi:TonB family protein